MELRRSPGLLSRLAATLLRGPARQKVALVVLTVIVTASGTWALFRWDASGGRVQFTDKLAFSLPWLLARASATPDTLTLDVKFKHWEKLAAKRAEALATGMLFASDDDYVPGTIRRGPDELPVRLRLKGDLLDHLEGDKWSFRVKVRGEETLLGMKRFSLQRPGTRHHLWEWLFHEAARREDVIALRYSFVSLVLNGKDLGIYALEEHFGKRLIENNRRREGVIVKFDENLWWKERLGFAIDVEDAEGSLPGSGDYLAAPIAGFQSSKIESSPVLGEQLALARSMLDGFRRGELAADDVFDVERMGRFLALCDLFGTHHGLHTNQYRFYYNPVTARLEPIPFDVFAGQRAERLIASFSEADSTRLWGGGKALFLSDLLRDPELHRRYVAALVRVSAPAYADGLLGDLRAEIEGYSTILRSEFPEFRLDESVLGDNQRLIRSMLDPPASVQAYLAGTDDIRGVDIEMGAVQVLPVEVLGVLLRDTRLLGEPVRLRERRHRSAVVDFTTRRFELPAGMAWQTADATDLEVVHRLAGTTTERRTPVLPTPRRSPELAASAVPRSASNVASFDWLVVDEQRRTVLVPAGRWTLSSDLVVGPGYELTCGAGTTVDLTEGALIVCHSPVAFVGTTEQPVRIVSSDGTGQGLVVLGAPRRSLLRHVEFSGLTVATKGAWRLTGAVTFYESDVDLVACRFANIQAEDGLNIVRSEFTMTACRFVDLLSDAFDGDFTRGTLTRCSFEGSGNDAVDVSGSDVTILDLRVGSAGDKGVSAGEHSTVRMTGSRLANCRVGVAAKDRSRVTIEDTRFSACELALAAYQKKAEFGPGTLEARGLTIESATHVGYRDAASTITLDGEPIGVDLPELASIVE